MTAPPRAGDAAVSTYLTRFAQAARATGADPARIGEALAEIETHVADTGETPHEAFGDPVAYAHQLGGPRQPETVWAAVTRLAALMYGAGSLGAAVFTMAHRRTIPTGFNPGPAAGRVIPQDSLAATADGFATAWIPFLVVPGLAALLVAATLTSSRHSRTRPGRPWSWLLFAVFLVVLLWFIPSALSTWQTLGYPTEEPWKYQLIPGIVFAGAAVLATARRRTSMPTITDPAGHDRTYLARDPLPVLLTSASGLLALLVFPLLPFTWF